MFIRVSLAFLSIQDPQSRLRTPPTTENLNTEKPSVTEVLHSFFSSMYKRLLVKALLSIHAYVSDACICIYVFHCVRVYSSLLHS